MKGKSAVTTTHAILSNLIYDGKINMHKKNVQTHLLTINEQDPFNAYISFLLEIDSLVDEMEYLIDQPSGKLDAAYNIERSWRQLLSLIIQIAYHKTATMIDKKDYGTALAMLNMLTLRLALYEWNPIISKELLSDLSKDVQKSFKDYNRYSIVKTKLGDKLIMIIENLKKDFLAKNGQKTTERHEKSG